MIISAQFGALPVFTRGFSINGGSVFSRREPLTRPLQMGRCSEAIQERSFRLCRFTLRAAA